MSREQQNVQNIRAAGSEIANMTQLLVETVSYRRINDDHGCGGGEIPQHIQETLWAMAKESEPVLTLLREIAQRRLRAALKTLAAEVEEAGVLKGNA